MTSPSGRAWIQGQRPVFQGQLDGNVAHLCRPLAGNRRFESLSEVVARYAQLAAGPDSRKKRPDRASKVVELRPLMGRILDVELDRIPLKPSQDKPERTPGLSASLSNTPRRVWIFS